MNGIAQLVLGYIIVAWGFFMIITAIPHPKQEDYIKKTEVTKCFDGFSWDRNVFHCQGEAMVDFDKNKRFYSAPEIDKLIKKLNKKLAE